MILKSLLTVVLARPSPSPLSTFTHLTERAGVAQGGRPHIVMGLPPNITRSHVDKTGTRIKNTFIVLLKLGKISISVYLHNRNRSRENSVHWKSGFRYFICLSYKYCDTKLVKSLIR